jgi:hypothetical protein
MPTFFGSTSPSVRREGERKRGGVVGRAAGGRLRGRQGNYVRYDANNYFHYCHCSIIIIKQCLPRGLFSGVGFSYGERADYVDGEEGVGEDLYQFLQAFFKANEKYRELAFYIFGESYGGE